MYTVYCVLMYTVYYTIVYCGILYTVYCIFNVYVVVYGIGAGVHCIICPFDSLITQASISLGTVEPQFYFAVAQQPDIPNIPKLNELMTVSRNITLHTIDNTVAVDRLGSQQSGVSVPVQFPNPYGFACSPSDANVLRVAGKCCDWRVVQSQACTVHCPPRLAAEEQTAIELNR